MLNIETVQGKYIRNIRSGKRWYVDQVLSSKVRLVEAEKNILHPISKLIEHSELKNYIDT